MANTTLSKYKQLLHILPLHASKDCKNSKWKEPAFITIEDVRCKHSQLHPSERKDYFQGVCMCACLFLHCYIVHIFRFKISFLAAFRNK